MRRTWLWWMMTAALVLPVAVGTAPGQESGAPEGEEEAPPWISADLPPSAYGPATPRPGHRSRLFDGRYSKVWKKLVRLLESEGLVVTALDKDSGSIQTEMKIFDEIKGPFQNVATRPPAATRRRPIRQMVALNRGRYTLDIQVSDEEEGVKVAIEAYIEERAYHIGENVRVWAERHSNGTIEKYFHDKLEEAL